MLICAGLMSFLLSLFSDAVLIFALCVLLCHPQKVKMEQGKALAEEFELKFFETSAKLNINVDKAFVSIATDIVARLKVNPDYDSEGGMNLNKDKGKTSAAGSKGCC